MTPLRGGTGAYAEDGDGQLTGGTTGVNVAYPDAAVAHDDEAVRSSPSPQVRQPRALPRIRVATGVDDGPTVPVASAGRRAVSGDAKGSLTVQCAAARGLPRRGFCAPGLVYFGAEFGEPVFVARRVGRSAGSGCGLVRPRRIAGQRPVRRSSRRARPWRRSPARARRRPGALLGDVGGGSGGVVGEPLHPPRRAYAGPGPAPRRPRRARRWPPPVARSARRPPLSRPRRRRPRRPAAAPPPGGSCSARADRAIASATRCSASAVTASICTAAASGSPSVRSSATTVPSVTVNVST